MRFLLDHDVPDDIEYSLAALGHDVIKLREVLPGTPPDEEVLRLAGERDAILITCNRDDFLSLAGRAPHHSHPAPHACARARGVGSPVGQRRRIRPA